MGDLKKRYQDPNIQLLLNKTTFLDPRMKTLVHLSQTEQESVLNSLTDEMAMASVQTQSDEPTSAGILFIADQNNDTSAQCKKLSALQKLLGDSFFHSSDGDDQAPASVSLNELILSEISRYKAKPLLALNEKILDWWQSHGPRYPNLKKMAKKYLAIVATSVPSERLFSTAGNIINAKRSSLDPSNVEKLIFLHDNASKIENLPYKRAHLIYQLS